MNTGDLDNLLSEQGLIPSGESREFTDTTLPQALLRSHALTDGNWAVLRILRGCVTFVDLGKDEICELVAPCTVTIEPESPHRLELNGPVRLRLHFCRKLPDTGEAKSGKEERDLEG